MTANFSMRTRLLLLCGFISAISIGVGFKDYFSMKSVVADYDIIVDTIAPKVANLDEMQVAFRNVRIGLRSLGLAGLSAADSAKYSQEAVAGIEVYEIAVANYSKHPMIEGEKDIYENMMKAWANFKKLGQDVLILSKDTSPEAQARLFQIFQVDCPEHAAAFQTAIDKVDALLAEHSERQAASANAEAESAYWLSGILNIAGFLASIFLGLMTANGLAAQVRRVADRLTSEAGEVSGTVSQLSFASKELSTSATQQAAAIQQTAASVEEISAMVSKNADNAADSSKLSEQSREQAERGKKTVEQMIISMAEINASNQNIQDEIHNNNTKISEIVTVIRAIGEKTKVINDIVFQTKLLSFNASVEAARAGEHGKGFSVVAEEVGNLAQMSGNAAKEISGLLEQSVSTVEKIVVDTKSKVEKLMVQAKSTVDRGGEVAQQCGEILQQIVANAGQLSEMVNNISLASKEQSHGVSEISRAIHELDKSTQVNATATQQTASSASHLAGEVESLKEASILLRAVVEGKNSKPVVAKFVWKDQYSLGISAMDDEHKVLIDKINDLAEGIDKGVKQPELKRLFTDLSNYVVEHFSDEERFLEGINYPELDQHKAIHRKLIARVGEFDHDLQNGRLDSAALVAFLNDWLIQHILGVDMRYSRFHAAEHKPASRHGTAPIPFRGKTKVAPASRVGAMKRASGDETVPRHDDPDFDSV